MTATATGRAYLHAAESAVALLREPAVASAWHGPSALEGMTVGGLAAHLARQVVRVPRVLAAPAPDEEPIPLLDHYARSTWVEGGNDDEANVRIRRDAEQDAAGGAAGVLAAATEAVEQLRAVLPETRSDRVVSLPWTSWALAVDDLLLTRMVEIAVHSDDLAVSVGVATPSLPPAVLEPVLDLLTRLSVRRHGSAAVLRALSRSERAPATVAAL